MAAWDPPQAVPPSGYGGPSVCYRHGDREAHIRCQRCNRPICPDCMVPASVGFQCPECVQAGRRDVRSARTEFGGRLRGPTALVTKVLIAVNVLMFGLQYVGGSAFTNRLEMLTGPALYPDGMLGGVATGQWWRLLTGAFLHVSIFHIGVNMFSLWMIGPALERQLGRARYLAVYLIAALGGSVAVMLFSDPRAPVVGASGAVFGVFGAAAVLWRRLGYDIRAVGVVLAINVVINVVFANALSWQGHVGGIVTGGLIGAIIGYAPGRGRVRARNQWIGTWLAVVILIVLAVLRARSLT